MEKNNIWKKRRVEFAALTRQGMSMTCIAKMHGITKQAVSLVLKKATADGEIVFKNRKNKNDNPNYIVKISRKYVTKKCKECQKDFLATPSNKRKTCSEDCLQKNKYRQREMMCEFKIHSLPISRKYFLEEDQNTKSYRSKTMHAVLVKTLLNSILLRYRSNRCI